MNGIKRYLFSVTRKDCRFCYIVQNKNANEDFQSKYFKTDIYILENVRKLQNYFIKQF